MWKRWHLVRDMNLRSSVIWSVVTVDNASFQLPIKRMDVGLEYLRGARQNKDGERVETRQVQFVVI